VKATFKCRELSNWSEQSYSEARMAVVEHRVFAVLTRAFHWTMSELSLCPSFFRLFPPPPSPLKNCTYQVTVLSLQESSFNLWSTWSIFRETSYVIYDVWTKLRFHVWFQRQLEAPVTPVTFSWTTISVKIKFWTSFQCRQICGCWVDCSSTGQARDTRQAMHV
jgi:hypothetical protein